MANLTTEFQDGLGRPARRAGLRGDRVPGAVREGLRQPRAPVPERRPEPPRRRRGLPVHPARRYRGPGRGDRVARPRARADPGRRGGRQAAAPRWSAASAPCSGSWGRVPLVSRDAARRGHAGRPDRCGRRRHRRRDRGRPHGQRRAARQASRQGRRRPRHGRRRPRRPERPGNRGPGRRPGVHAGERPHLPDPRPAVGRRPGLAGQPGGHRAEHADGNRRYAETVPGQGPGLSDVGTGRGVLPGPEQHLHHRPGARERTPRGAGHRGRSRHQGLLGRDIRRPHPPVERPGGEHGDQPAVTRAWSTRSAPAQQVSDQWKKLSGTTIGMGKAFDVATMAQLQLGHSFEKNGKLTAQAKQMIANLYAGYAADEHEHRPVRRGGRRADRHVRAAAHPDRRGQPGV